VTGSGHDRIGGAGGWLARYVPLVSAVVVTLLGLAVVVSGASTVLAA
jgi:hypothetical protein